CAVYIRIPVEVGRQPPVLIEAVLVFQGIGRYRGQGLWTSVVADVRHLHFAVLEVEDLPDGQALTLETVVLNPAVGQAEGQLVGVADVVPAGEAVVAPQTAVAEAGLAAVEDRNLALVLVGDVEVEQARLQGLAEVTAEQPGVAGAVEVGVRAGGAPRACGRAGHGAAG